MQRLNNAYHCRRCRSGEGRRTSARVGCQWLVYGPVGKASLQLALIGPYRSLYVFCSRLKCTAPPAVEQSLRRCVLHSIHVIHFCPY